LSRLRDALPSSCRPPFLVASITDTCFIIVQKPVKLFGPSVAYRSQAQVWLEPLAHHQLKKKGWTSYESCLSKKRKYCVVMGNCNKFLKVFGLPRTTFAMPSSVDTQRVPKEACCTSWTSGCVLCVGDNCNLCIPGTIKTQHITQ